MVSRDPETGQFRSDGDGQALDYTDHYFTNFSLEAEQQGASNSSEWIEWTLEEPEIDNDELAQLRYLHLVLSTRNDPEAATANTSPGSIHAQAAIGTNLAGNEWVQDGSSGGVQQESSGADISEIGSSNSVSDDPGEWMTMSATAEAGYQDNTAGTAGGGSGGVDRAVRRFPDETGAGPWLDATDDVKVRMEVTKNTTDSDARGYVTGQLGWVILQDQSARPRYGLGD